MAALTEDFRHTAALGPVKLEIIKVTANASQDNPDTSLVSLLQNPTAVGVWPVNDDLGGTADGASAVVSGKAITVHDLSNSQEMIVFVFGF